MKKSVRRLAATALGAAILTSMVSCSSNSKDDLEYKLRRKNEKYSESAEKRRMRIRARQERTDMWFESIMGR